MNRAGGWELYLLMKVMPVRITWCIVRSYSRNNWFGSNAELEDDECTVAQPAGY